MPQMIIALSLCEQILERSPAHVCGCRLGNLIPISALASFQNALAIIQSI
jgi:hypothetical protein